MRRAGPFDRSKQAVPLIPSQLRPDYLDPIGQDRAGREVMTSRSAPHGVVCHRCSQAQTNVLTTIQVRRATAHVGQ